MGNEKTTTSTSQKSEATPEEKALMQQQLNMNNFMQPYAQQNYAALSDNINAILLGKTPTAQGIGGINDMQTQSMVNQSLRDIGPGFQSAGILDSGLSAQIAAQTAAGVRNQNAQFNVSAAQNLFNLAAGGQSNLQGQFQNNTNNLTSQLAGLRSISGGQTVSSMNPFLKSFQTEMGSGLAKTANAGISGGMGGGMSGFKAGLMK